MKLKFLHRVGALALALTMLLSGMVLPAGAEEGSGVTVTLSQTALELEVDGRARLSATVKKNGAVVADAAVTWSSKSVGTTETVVNTNKFGGVVGNVAGTAIVTATYTDTADGKTYTASCTVTVKQPTVAVIGVTIANADELKSSYDVGETIALTAKVEPAAATNQAVTWSSSDPSVAKVDAQGVVTAVSPGEATITVTTAEGGRTATVRLVVSGIVMPSSLEILAGQEKTLAALTYGKAPAQLMEWSSSNISIAEVTDGKITTYNLGTVTITAKAGKYRATCMVTVKEDLADAVETSMDASEVYAFSRLIHQIENKVAEKTGENLYFLSSISVPPSQGVLYYGYVSPDAPGMGVGGEAYYITPSGGQPALSDVFFVPKAGFSGTAVIRYTAKGTGGSTVNGSIRIAVAGLEDVSYNTASGRAVSFVTEDFTQVCKAKTGREISYITFKQPSPQQGVLYYNYSTTAQYCPEVDSATKYYRTNNPYLDKISFVPAEDFTGTVTIPYTCTTTGGTHSGTVTIIVYALPGSGEGKIEYTVASGDHVQLNATDLNDLCWDLNKASLNYVYFTQPDPQQGTLYYNYESNYDYGSVVSEGTRYFRTTSPRISYVSFVPAKGFSGTVKVPFTGYDITGDSFTGQLSFKVSGSTGTVYYSASSGQPVEFDGLDFNEVCQKATGASLDWISFELPASSKGVLYRSYYYNSGYSYRISASERLSRTQLSDVIFVPSNSFFGTVSIPFSGDNTSGGRFSGTVEIFVEASDGNETVEYTTVRGGVVEFVTADFNDACRAITGENLSYVQFTLPASRYGTLYYQYNKANGSGSTVYSNTSYYRGSHRLLGEVSFVAADNYSGSFTMTYTGWSVGGERFSGEIKMTVAQPVGASVDYRTTSLPVKLLATDFRQACLATMGRELSYIRFTSLPGEAQGCLYLNYTAPAKPGTVAKIDTNYYVAQAPSLGELTFLPKAEYQGTVSVGYTGYDVQGKSYSGTLTITVSNSGITSQFLDVGNFGWALPSIEYLRHSNVVTGYSATRYGPEQNISRGDYTLMLYRALQFSGNGTPVNYSDVPQNSYYAEAIAAATQLGISEGYQGKYYPTLEISRQSAFEMAYRALRAMGHEVPYVSVSVLNRFADADQVSADFKASMAAMVQMGIVRGDNNGCLNPAECISRAEMAVILHRILTS